MSGSSSYAFVYVKIASDAMTGIRYQYTPLQKIRMCRYLYLHRHYRHIGTFFQYPHIGYRQTFSVPKFEYRHLEPYGSYNYVLYLIIVGEIVYKKFKPVCASMCHCIAPNFGIHVAPKLVSCILWVLLRVLYKALILMLDIHQNKYYCKISLNGL